MLPWQLYPWRLWPLVWGESSEERERAAELLLAERDCCLDDVFTRKLQRLALDAASLTSAEMREFLTACFTRLVATSTFVERRFASYGAWSARRASACRLPMLAAKHVTSCVKEFVEHWRQREQVEKPKGAKSRPEWQVSAQKGLRQTGLHVFAQEQRQIMEGQWGAGAAACASFLATARSRWAKLSSAEKGKYSQLARERNAHSRALAMASQDREQKTGGPWDVASLRGRWPLDEDVLKSALAAAPFQNLAESWKADHSAVEADVLNVTEPGEHAVRLFAGCHPGLCQADLTVQQERARARLRANLCTLVRAEYPTPNRLGSGVLMLRFESASLQKALTCAVCFATRTQPPECALLELRATGSDQTVCPAELVLPARLKREEAGCRHLVKEAADWSLSVLRIGDPGNSLAKLSIVAEEAYSQEALDAKRRELQLQEAALRAAKLAKSRQKQQQKKRKRAASTKMQPAKAPSASKAKSKTARAAADGQRSRTGSAAGQDLDESSDLQTLPGVESSESPSEAVMTDTEAAGYESLAVAARAAVAEEPPSPPTAPLQEAARPGGSRAGRVWHRRGEACLDDHWA